MKYLIILLLLMAVFGCSRKGMTLEQVQSVKLEVQALLDTFITSAQKLETTAMEQYLGDDPQLRFYIQGKAYRKAELISLFKELYAPLESQKLQVIEQKITVLSPEAAVWTAIASSLQTKKDGGVGALNLTETWLWQKLEDKWVVTHYHESFRDALPPQPEDSAFQQS